MRVRRPRECIARTCGLPLSTSSSPSLNFCCGPKSCSLPSALCRLTTTMAPFGSRNCTIVKPTIDFGMRTESSVTFESKRSDAALSFASGRIACILETHARAAARRALIQVLRVPAERRLFDVIRLLTSCHPCP